jgi:hypothetical protein
MLKFFRRKQKQETKATPLSSEIIIPLADQIRAGLPIGMSLPEPLAKLFTWIEHHNFTRTQNRATSGWLFDISSREAVSAPIIEFNSDGSKNLKHWFGLDSPEIHDRLFVFCKTGQEGSQGAFWLDDDGKQHIVHLGGGSGSIMTCILTDDAIDFLRLLAVGYEEICWGGYELEPTFDVPLNQKFHDWVKTEFGVSIPKAGNTIVPRTAEVTDAKTSSDQFLKWVTKMVDQGDYA